MTPTVAFVTISYGPDRERCALLRRSMDVFAPTVEHWIVVEGADLPPFRPLQDTRTTLVSTEELLPLWLRRVNLRRVGLKSSMWIQKRGKPVRGWLVQQLAKLAIAEQVKADVLVHADSDVVLVRPFQTGSVVDENGRVRLYESENAIDEGLPSHVRWHRSAEKLLGIEAASLPLPDFISGINAWKRTNALALLERIQRQTGRHWLRALTAAWDVSEYTLYGRFVQDVLGESAGQFVSTASLCRDYFASASKAELASFLDGVGPDEIGVSIDAKAGMRPADYVGLLEERWTALRG